MNINVIPTPKCITGGGAPVPVIPLINYGAFDREAKVFAHFAEEIGARFDFSVGKGIITERDSKLADGEYKLSVARDGIVIRAGDKYGTSYAFSTLLSMLDISSGGITAPEVTVSDSPDCDYRGLLIDCARSFHTLDEIKKYIDLCWFYKIKYLHIHFTDDENYALPSRRFPCLPTEGHSFSFDEIAEMNKYASVHAVQIIPEVDTPGHSTAIRKAYPELFGEKGIICFHEDSIRAVGDIYREVCRMFPDSDYIHIGGDESRLGWWLDCEECIGYGDSIGIKLSDEAPDISPREYVMLRYLAYFIKKNAEAVLECGKTPIVWEGFHKSTNAMIPKEVAVMVFDSSYQLADSLTSAPFKVINCSWFPTYVVTPCWYYKPEDCFDWDIFSFSTVNDASPFRNGVMRYFPDKSFIGGQLSSWGDVIEKDFPTKEDGHRDEMKKICERLPAISENTWNKEKRCTKDSFMLKLCRTGGKVEKILGE